MKLTNALLASAAATEVSDIQRRKTLGELLSPGAIEQLNLNRKGILNNILPAHHLEELESLCNPCRTDVQISDFWMYTSPPRDLLSRGSPEAIMVYYEHICHAVNCRDRNTMCPQWAGEGKCSEDWAQRTCSQSCGCTASKTCNRLDQFTPRVDNAVVNLEEEDAEHSAPASMPIHDAIKYLDPTRILAQFTSDVRATLRDQMCFLPDVDSRIIASNDLLKVLTEDAEMAKILNALSPKLPMYLTAIPESMKATLANEVICGGYVREPRASMCMDKTITPETLFCRARLPRWTYDRNQGICRQIDYDGCFKTSNRFLTKEQCEETCEPYIVTVSEVNRQKLNKFIGALTPLNLRESMLTLFGKTEAEETTKELVNQACNPEMGAIRADYRDVLCNKLNEVLGQPAEIEATSEPEETCEAKTSEREFCTKKPGRNFKNACQEAGCCWDPKPSSTRPLWKHYCFKKSVAQKSIEASVVVNDAEHIASPDCNVPTQRRSWCTARPSNWANPEEARNYCESKGCCFATNPKGKVYPVWKYSCFSGN